MRQQLVDVVRLDPAFQRRQARPSSLDQPRQHVLRQQIERADAVARAGQDEAVGAEREQLPQARDDLVRCAGDGDGVEDPIRDQLGVLRVGRRVAEVVVALLHPLELLPEPLGHLVARHAAVHRPRRRRDVAAGLVARALPVLVDRAGQPDQAPHRAGVAARLARSLVDVTEAVADEVEVGADLEQDAVRDPACEGEGPRTGRRQPQRNRPARPPGQARLRSVPVGRLTGEKCAQAMDGLLEPTQTRGLHPDGSHGALADADPEQRPPAGQLVEGRDRARDRCWMSGDRIRHAGREGDAIRSQGCSRQRQIGVAEDRLRVGDPDTVEAELLGLDGDLRDLGRRAVRKHSDVKLGHAASTVIRMTLTSARGIVYKSSDAASADRVRAGGDGRRGGPICWRSRTRACWPAARRS